MAEWNSTTIYHHQWEYTYRAGGTGPADPASAGPIIWHSLLIFIIMHTPSFDFHWYIEGQVSSLAFKY